MGRGLNTWIAKRIYVCSCWMSFAERTRWNIVKSSTFAVVRGGDVDVLQKIDRFPKRWLIPWFLSQQKKVTKIWQGTYTKNKTCTLKIIFKQFAPSKAYQIIIFFQMAKVISSSVLHINLKSCFAIFYSANIKTSYDCI